MNNIDPKQFEPLDEYERDLMEAIEDPNYQPIEVPKEETEELIRKLREGNQTFNYQVKKGEIEKLKNSLENKGAKKEYLDEIDNFFNTHLILEK